MRSVAEKMGLKTGSRAYFTGVPPAVLSAMRLPELEISRNLSGMFDHVHLFVSSKQDLDQQFPTLRSHVGPKGKLWVSWPKGGGGGTDLNIREVIRIGYTHGMVESTALSVDDDWSAIKFTHPIPGKTYHNSYGKLPSG